MNGVTRTAYEARLEAVAALKPGDAVVFNPEDGGSVSAVVVKLEGRTLHIRFAAPYLGRQRGIIGRADWHRVVPFPKNTLFMVTEGEA